MTDIVKDEQAKANAVYAWGDLEYQVAIDIIDWVMTQPNIFHEMKHAINAYWYERLN